MRGKTVIITVLLYPFLAMSGQEKMGDIAVTDIVVSGTKMPPADVRILTEQIREAAIKLTNYRVMTRESVWAILRDKKIDLAKCTGVECAVDFGRMLQADKIIVTEMVLRGADYYISMRLYDCASASIDNSLNRVCEACKFKGLVKIVREIALELLGGTKGEGMAPKPRDEAREGRLDITKITLDCDAGDFDACLRGFFFYAAQGSNKREDFFKKLASLKDAQFYNLQCKLGKKDLCFILGMMYARGEGVRKDLEMAVSLYKKACDIGNAPGCTGLGVMYAKGEGVEKDPKKAVSLLKKACDMGGATACNNLKILKEK